MKFAIVNGQRTEAQTELSGECPVCKAALVAKCGEIRIWHWAHIGKRMCDHWWEPETDWHRTWKGHFPAEWQEFIQFAPDGEKHIADVKTEQGWVLEFQYSFLKPEERRARNAFYPQLVWVVNGMRRPRDRDQFARALEARRQLSPEEMLSVPTDECALIKEWTNTSIPVFFDFGEEAPLWGLLPGAPNGLAYIGTFPRAVFVDLHKGGTTQAGLDFTSLMKVLNDRIAIHLAECKAREQIQLAGQNRYNPLRMFVRPSRHRRF